MKKAGGCGLAVLLWLVPRAVTAQGIRTVVHFPLRLIDLSVAPDTVSGLHILMQPSPRSEQARDGKLIWLRFAPDTVMDWINSAAAALAVAVPNGPEEGIQWSRTLRPRGGQGGISMGRALRKGRLEKTRWLAIGDSAIGWRAELTGSEADSLLHLLMNLGLKSRLDTTPSGPRDFREVDVPVSVLYQPKPRWGKASRVVATYVVDESGKADPASFLAILASDPGLIGEAWEVVKASRYTPAVQAGRPVRQLVQRVIRWTP